MYMWLCFCFVGVDKTLGDFVVGKLLELSCACVHARDNRLFVDTYFQKHMSRQR